MNTGPNPIDFGVVPPQGGMTAYFWVYDAQSSALLEARITDDDSNGRFSLKMLRSYTKRPVSGGLPHTPWGGPGFNLIETDFTDGTRPLRVSMGQLVGIELRFDDAGTDAQGQFGATLVINDTSRTNPWLEITAKMIAIVASITTTLPVAVELTQGQPATVPITIVSNVGPDTTVSYTLWGFPPGISMEPLLDVPLPRGGRVARNLSFQAAPDAPLGVLEVSIDSKAFNNKLDIQLKLPVVVIAPLPSASQAATCQSLENLSVPWGQENYTWSNWGIGDSQITLDGYFTTKVFKPTNPYEISQAIMEAVAEKKTIRAVGSGWSFSEAVLPQSSPIWGADQLIASLSAANGISAGAAASSLSLAPEYSKCFGYAIDATTLDRSLQALLPSILEGSQDVGLFFFAEAGMTLNFLNALLDSQTRRVALSTLGGGGGQTIAGAISMGTHGGDFDLPPLADSVRAIYLVGGGGVHHWIEPLDRRITDPAKIQATFPCISTGNIHYDNDMFHAALVSMGAMGVIYAVVLDVVDQYSLLQWNKWSTWENLNADTDPQFDTLFDGTWSGLANYMSQEDWTNRFVQVVINPIRNADGSHNCYVSNRVLLPLQDPSGVKPNNDLSTLGDDAISAITNSPEAGLLDEYELNNFKDQLKGKGPIEQFQLLCNFCKDENYPWAIRAVIDVYMRKSLPEPGDPPKPQVDIGYKVMAPGTSTFPPLAGISIEAAFDFPDAIRFVDSVLQAIDEGVHSRNTSDLGPRG